MREFIHSVRCLGFASLVVGGGDTLLRVFHIITVAQPLGLFAISGFWLLLRTGSKEPAVRSVILFSGLTLGWALICLSVLAFAHPKPFVPLSLLLGYVIGSTLLGVWAWLVLNHVGKASTANSGSEAAIKLGSTLGAGTRRWLQRL